MKKLTIAIPTLNRCEYLRFTLYHFIDQMNNLIDEIEIIIVNNNSDDDTSSMIKQLVKKHSYIRFFDCKERLPLGDQFIRTVGYAEGEYIILWGDDDIPAPFILEYLLRIINHKESQLYYFNRLSGYEDGNNIKSVSIDDNYYPGIKTIYKNSTLFLQDNFLRATFMTSLMFHKDVWAKGLEFNTSNHYGYEFLSKLYYGNQGKSIAYYHYPLCIQRKVAFREWGPNWPMYKLLGIPNLISDLEKERIFLDGLKIWREQFNGFPLFCYTLMAAATDKKKYKPYCQSFAKYQKGILRKTLIYIIIYFFPGWFYNVSRKILFRIKK